MHIVGEEEYMRKNMVDLQSNDFNRKSNNFTGYVMYYDLDENLLEGKKYEKGKLTKRLRPIEKDEKQGKFIFVTHYVDWYVHDKYVDTTTYVTVEWVDDNLYPDDFYYDGCQFFRCPGDYYYDPCPGCYGNGNVQNNNLVDIKNYIRDFCVGNRINNLIYNNDAKFKNILADFKSKFLLSEKMNITFEGRNNTEMGGKLRETLVATDDLKDGVVTDYVATIFLNMDKLPQASEQLVYTVILHETVHSLIHFRFGLYEIGANTIDHQLMAQSYMEFLEDSMKKIYGPNNSYESHFLPLAFYGISQDINKYPDLFKEALKKYGLTLNEIMAAGANHLDRTVGYPCK